LKQLLKNIQEKTTASFICVSDLRYHCRGNVKKVKVTTNSNSRRNVKKGKLTANDKCYRDQLIMNDGEDETLPVTICEDGEYYICHSCHRTLEKNRVPKCNEKKHQFMVPELPDEFKTADMKLNNCEAHLLKLIIPFIRVAHIPRSSEFKVFGPVINVEADIAHSFNKILPLDQDLIPVALKRRPEYRGAYIEEIVSKNKLLKYFIYFKANNHLFADIQFNDDVLDNIIKELKDDIERQDDWKSAKDVKLQEAPIIDENDENSDDEGEIGRAHV
jgi:hypothetical protein